MLVTSKLNRERKRDNLDINCERYEFIDDILDDDTISNGEKDIFWNEFARKYIDSKEFRYETHGKYIVFDKNNIYRGYFSSKNEAAEFINEKGLIFSYIGDDQVHGKMYKFVKHEYGGEQRGCYKINLKINFECGFRYEEEYTIDTDCTDTSTFMACNWNTKVKAFMKLKRDGFPEAIFEELNRRKDNLEKITMDGIGTKNKYFRLTFEPPLPVFFESLEIVYLKYVIVPRYDEQKEEERLIGTDFVESSYDYHFSKFNDEFGLLVSNL